MRAPFGKTTGSVGFPYDSFARGFRFQHAPAREPLAVVEAAGERIDKIAKLETLRDRFVNLLIAPSGYRNRGRHKSSAERPKVWPLRLIGAARGTTLGTENENSYPYPSPDEA